MPRTNGHALPAREPESVCYVLESIEGCDAKIALHEDTISNLQEERAGYTDALLRTVRACPDRVIIHRSFAYLLDRGLVLRRPCVLSHEVLAVEPAPEPDPAPSDQHPVFGRTPAALVTTTPFQGD